MSPRIMPLFLAVVLGLVFANARISDAARPLKKLVAIELFENKSGTETDYELETALTDMLTDQLIKTGNYIIVERQAVQSFSDDQDFDGRYSGYENTVRNPVLAPVQVLIRGTISDFSYDDGGEPDINVRGFSLNMNKGSAKIVLAIRLIDAYTGQTIDSGKVQGTAGTEPGLNIRFDGGSLQFGQKDFSASPAGTACRLAIDEAVNYITQRLKNIPWEGKIVDVKEGLVVINSGSNAGIREGDIFDVFKKGGEFVDPDTGMTLDAELEKIGQVKIVEVQRKYSKAAPVSGSGFHKRNIVRAVNSYPDYR